MSMHYKHADTVVKSSLQSWNQSMCRILSANGFCIVPRIALANYGRFEVRLAAISSYYLYQTLFS